MRTALLILSLLLLVGCQDATSSTPQASAPTTPLTRTAQKLADGTCGSRLIHDSLVASYVTYGEFCPVPANLIVAHKDGSLPNSQYGAGVAYQTWETNDGDCNPRADHIFNVVNHASCFKHLENYRWMFDTAYKMPNEITYGM